MFEYEGLESEPQEHDEIGMKIMELVKEEVKAKMTETVDNLEMFRKINAGFEVSLRKERQEHAELKQKYAKELNAALLEKGKEVMRELFGGITRGDKAFYTDYKYVNTVCVKCTGKGKVTALIDGEELKVKCPVCEGNGSKGSGHFVVKEGKVETICLEINEYRKHLNFYFVGKDSKIEGDKVFKNMEDCQKCCDEKNKPKEVAV